jgi:Ca2+-binding RTX toxin-like protein
MSRQQRLAVATAAVAAALFAAPAAAPAATSCDYSSTGKFLEILMPAPGDTAVLSVSDPPSANAGEIRLIGTTNTSVTCTGGTPTVSNTGVISVVATGGSDNSVFVTGSDEFTPGPDPQDGSDNAGGTPEIEIFVNLNNGTNSFLRVDTSPAGGEIRFGTDGINPNVPGESQPDADIFPSNVPKVIGQGLNGPNTLSAQGGAGTGGPLSGAIVLSGGASTDTLVGAEGGDDLLGHPGNDVLRGMGGNDLLEGDLGNDELSGGVGDDLLRPGRNTDVVDGGPGLQDRVTYGESPTTGVSVDLASAGDQDTGGFGGVDSFAGIENAEGTPFADTLRGDGGANRLLGLQGNDVLEGRGGVDVLEANQDDDSLDVRDGGPDSADCGPETDTVTADLPGIDTLLQCETVLFPEQQAQQTNGVAAPGAAAGPAGAAGAAPAAPADGVAPAFTANPLADPRTFEVDRAGAAERPVSTTARKGTTFRYSLSEAATVTFAIQRKTSGRRVRGRCRKRTRANARNRKCNLFKRVGAFRAPATAGRNGKRFSGRIGNRTLRPAGYRALLVATDAAGNRSRQATVAFKVVAPRRRR